MGRKILAGLLLPFFWLSADVSAATKLPPGFSESVFVQGFEAPTSMAFSPDGRLFVCQKGGFGFDWSARGEAAVRVVKDGELLPAPFITLPVVTVWECGLHGIAFDPDFEENGWVYFTLSATNSTGGAVNRIIRVTASAENPDVADPGSVTIILDDVPAGFYHNGGSILFGPDDKIYYGTGYGSSGPIAQNLESLSGKVLRLNRDGSIPDDNPFRDTPGARAEIWAYGFRQAFKSAVDPVGKGGTGRIFVNDVGYLAVEEVNELLPGRNYGWPNCEGSCGNPDFTSPLWEYTHSEKDTVPTNCTSSAISGGDFYRHTHFPGAFHGKYFVSDYAKGWIRVVDPTTGTASDFASGAENPIDVKVGPDGALYYLAAHISAYEGEGRRVYRIAHNQPPQIQVEVAVQTPGVENTLYRLDATGSTDPEGQTLAYEWLLPDGTVLRDEAINVTVPVGEISTVALWLRDDLGGASSQVVTLGDTAPGTGPTLNVDAASMPLTLSQTEVFSSLADLTPAPGVVPYEVNTPLWSDGAHKLRWIRLPEQGRARFSAEGDWEFPPGTVFIKHFEMPPSVTLDQGRHPRLETRFLVRAIDGHYFGVTYRWRPDGSDADLLTEGEHEVLVHGGLPDGRHRSWDYPSRTDCFQCHRPESGFVLGVNTRQLNNVLTEAGTPKNQLKILEELGLFSEPLPSVSELADLPRLKALDDTAATLEDRVKSYLDANCAHCHQPESRGIYARFDARYGTVMADQNLIDGPVLNGHSMDADISKIVLPRVLDEWKSGSILHMRMSRHDRFRMPPLASGVSDTQALELIGQWIRSLAVPPATNSLKTSDLLLQNPVSGQIHLWTQNGTGTDRQFLQADSRSLAPWFVLGIDDFNGDRHQDLLWQNRVTGELSIWIINPAVRPYSGGISFAAFSAGNVPFGTKEYVGSGDFDNNGQTDLFWQEAGTGIITVWTNNNGFGAPPVMGTAPFPAEWKPVGVADFNLDGKLDIVCLNRTNDQVGVWLMDGLETNRLHVFELELRPTAQFMGIIDENNDGHPDLHWKDEANSEWFAWTVRDLRPVHRVALPYGDDSTEWSLIAPSLSKDRWYPMSVGIRKDTGDAVLFEWNAAEKGWIVIQRKNRLDDPLWQDWMPNLDAATGFRSAPINLDSPHHFFRFLRQIQDPQGTK